MTNLTVDFDYSIFNSSLIQIATYSEKFILPCLLLIGTTCNTLTFLVMRRGRMRHSSSCFYMAALALADTFVLWIGCFNRWLELIDRQRPILACNLCCKLGTFAFFFFADCSVWITVAMTFERYIAVSQPLRANQICTIKRARYILLFIGLLFFFINSHFLWTFHLSPKESHCIPVNEQSIFLKYFTWFDSFKYSFCPFMLLITLNILIIQSLLNARNTNKFLDQQSMMNQRKDLNSKSSSVSSTSASTNYSGNLLIKTTKRTYSQQSAAKILAYRKVNRRLTTMLLAVSFAFCICSMPIAIMQLIDVIYSNVQHRSTTMNIAITFGKIISEISQYLNHSSNFFLYAFTGRIFRHELRRLFFCHRYHFYRSSSSSKHLKKQAIFFHSYQNPTEGLHEQFYFHGKCHTKIVIAPKHFLALPVNDKYRQSLSSTYSLSHIPLTKTNSSVQQEQFLTCLQRQRSNSSSQTSSVVLVESTNLVQKPKSTLNSLIKNIQINQTTPLLRSSLVHQTLKPYGLIDTTLHSS